MTKFDIYNGKVNYVQVSESGQVVTTQIMFANEADRNIFVGHLRKSAKDLQTLDKPKFHDWLPGEESIYHMAQTGRGFGLQITATDDQIRHTLVELVESKCIDHAQWEKIYQDVYASRVPPAELAKESKAKPATAALIDFRIEDPFVQIEPPSERSTSPLAFAQIEQPFDRPRFELIGPEPIPPSYRMAQARTSGIAPLESASERIKPQGTAGTPKATGEREI